MEVLIAAVTVTGVVLVLNLLLTYGLARKVAYLSAQVANGGRRSLPPESRTVPAGSRVGHFVAPANNGEEISDVGFSGDVFVGFFTPGCGSCGDRIPEFRDLAARGNATLLAVISGRHGEWREMQAALTGAVRVVVDDGPQGTVTSAFGVDSWPAFCHVRGDGEGLVVVASGASPDIFPVGRREQLAN